jgi:hypothetical protein
MSASIPELAQICPQIFPSGLSVPGYTDRTDNATNAKKYDINNPLDPLLVTPASIFGLDLQWFKFILFTIGSGVVAACVALKTNNMLLGAACMVPTAVLSVEPGIISFILLGVIAFLAGLALVWIFVWSKAY